MFFCVFFFWNKDHSPNKKRKFNTERLSFFYLEFWGLETAFIETNSQHAKILFLNSNSHENTGCENIQNRQIDGHKGHFSNSPSESAEQH